MKMDFFKLFKRENKTKLGKAEEILVVVLVVGAVLLSAGLLLSIYAPQGASALAAMIGAALAFISLVGLVAVWFAKEGFK